MVAFTAALALSLLVLSASAVPSPRSSGPVFPNCQEVNFQVTASAKNYHFSLNISDQGLFTKTVESVVYTVGSLITETVDIAGVYCEPETYNATRYQQLEFLIPSIPYNRSYFTGLGPPGGGIDGDSYSWINYASKQGYPTLTIDRLGTGKSSHPDPILVVQGPYEYATYHQIIQAIKSGAGGILPRTFQDITLIGNSYGSVCVDNIVALYPNDVKRAIMTGYSAFGIESLPGIFDLVPVPASIARPAKYGNLPLGYVTATSESGLQGSGWGIIPTVLFDPAVPPAVFAAEDVVSLGAFISNYIDGATVANGFTGRALVLTGEQDDVFCGLGSQALGTPHCGSQLAKTKKLFPNADYNWHSVNQTGHFMNFHTSRQDTFKIAHDFIAGAHFAEDGPN